MIRLEIKNYDTILIEMQPKYQLCHQRNLISRNILQVKKYYHLIKKQMIEQAKFTYSSLGKAFKKQVNQLKIKEKNK